MFRSRKRRRWTASGFLIALASVLVDRPATARATELWLTGLAPARLEVMHPGMRSDYMDLFRADFPWPRTASRVQVIKITSGFADQTSEADLQVMFADLRRRHIALALEAGLMTERQDCSQHVEGYNRPGPSSRIAERIRQAGGDLQYLAMDEPLWFGHQVRGANACHASIDDVARDVAFNIAAYRRVFPSVQVGDIEPAGMSAPAEWVDEIMQWALAYRQATGGSLAFFDADVTWDGPWRRQLPVLASRLHAAGIKFGIIYDGGPGDQTGLAWTLHAEELFAEVEFGLRLTPDQAILQTWMPQPDHMLPETEPGTMTWLVNRYAAAPARLDLRRVNTRLEGELTGLAGRPIGGAPITLAAESFGDWTAPAVHTLSGRVPSNAPTAIFALRINAECHCSGPADIGVGPMLYRDDRTGATVRQAFQGPEGTAAALVHFQARPGQAITQNVQRFPVMPGDPFTIQVPMRTDPASEDSGYVALIFLWPKDTGTREFLCHSNRRRPPSAGSIPMPTATSRFCSILKCSGPPPASTPNSLELRNIAWQFKRRNNSRHDQRLRRRDQTRFDRRMGCGSR